MVGNRIQTTKGLECWTKEFDKGGSLEEGDHMGIFKNFTFISVYRMTSGGIGLKLVNS